ncbi:MAG: threonylcarbamoyl-AMP synthase [Acidobacteria bacterium]|nr:MAG: threonylcarbamoyl-AMP synthase [Acidobacteriota bacterium]
MRILNIHPQNPQGRLIQMAIDHLEQSGVIAYPTDTCYGLGCSIFQKKGIDKLNQLKRHKKNKAMSMICSDLKHISDFGIVSNTAYKLMRKLLPGPYTFVLPATRLVPKLFQNKRKQVGIRVPDNKVITELVHALGHPIVSTTCQLPGDESPCADIYDIKDRFGNFIEMAIDGDYLYPEVSTVVMVEDDRVDVLREGKGDIAPFRAYMDTE